MKLDVQFKLKSNPMYLEYLHSNSYWYKYLNRDESSINDFINEVKINYKLRPVDKITNAINTLDMLSNVLNTLK